MQSLKFRIVTVFDICALPFRSTAAAIRRQNKLLFFEMPRTASGSISATIKKYGIATHGHRRGPKYKFLRDKKDISSYSIFSVIRHPEDRFISGFCLLRDGGNNPEDLADSKKFMLPNESLNEFALRYYENEGLKPSILDQRHFTPQFEYLRDNEGKLLPVKLFIFSNKDFITPIMSSLGIPSHV